MRACIPSFLITFFSANPWFDHACSSDISDREGVHKSYQASPSGITHATFISAKIHGAHYLSVKGKLIGLRQCLSLKYLEIFKIEIFANLHSRTI